MGGVDVEALFLAHRDELLVFLARRTADPQAALDLWAETFAQAALQRRRCRAQTPAEQAAWLRGIARRLLAGWYRRVYAEQRALRRLALEPPAATPDALTELERRAGLVQVRDALAPALEALSPPSRDAVRLRVLDELSYGQIARCLGIGEQAARARVSRGPRALAARVEHTIIREALQP